jgi:hypothetical protein
MEGKAMKKFLSIVSVSLLGLLTITALAFSQHGHGGGAGNQQPAMKMNSTDVFADGLQVTFMVMRNTTHKGMLEKMKMKEELEPGSTHNIMVLIRDEKTGKEFTNGKVILKVVGPDEKEQVKSANYKEMMRTYDAYFNLSGEGKYQVAALFEISGQKRVVGISFEIAP